jgi:hypothetical protein
MLSPPPRKGGRLLPSRRGCPGLPKPKRTSGPGLVIEAPPTIGVPLDVANQPSAASRALHPLDGELVASPSPVAIVASTGRLHCGQTGSATPVTATRTPAAYPKYRAALTDSAHVSWRAPPFVRCVPTLVIGASADRDRQLDSCHGWLGEPRATQAARHAGRAARRPLGLGGAINPNWSVLAGLQTDAATLLIAQST